MSPQPRTPKRLLIAGAVATLVASSACADDDGGGEAAPLPAAPPGSTMPFDLYLGQDVTFILYAERQLQASCMEDAGYPQFVDTGDRLGENMFADLVKPPFRPRTEDEARANGFHGPVPGAPAPVVSFDVGFDRALDACRARGERTLGTSRDLLATYVEQLGNSLNREIWQKLQPVEVKTADRLLDCLAAKGFEPDSRDAYKKDPNPHERFDVPLGAYEPEAPQWKPRRKPGTVAVGPPDPDRRYVPTEGESRLAVAMVRCRKETGFFAKIDRVNREAQQKIVEDHAVEFGELNPKIKAAAKRAAKALDG
jgi:hypothetical protein